MRCMVCAAFLFAYDLQGKSHGQDTCGPMGVLMIGAGGGGLESPDHNKRTLFVRGLGGSTLGGWLDELISSFL